MTKQVQRLRIPPGMQEEYKRRHDNLWPEMGELLRQCGIRNYTIWSYDGDMFAYCEVDDPETCRKVLAGSEVKERWDEYMSDILTVPEGEARLMFEFN